MEKFTQEDIDVYTIDSGVLGPHFMISGSVHGNEKAGPKALTKLLKHLEQGEITLEKGSLTIVPICNPKAYEQDVRFVDYNLNRSMYPRSDNEIEHYEDRLRNVLCPLLEKCDYLLDLHSCTAPSEAFVILGGDYHDPKNVSFAKGVGASRILWGWAEAVGSNDNIPDPRHAFGMTEYAREHGATAVTIECGNHTHPRGADMAFQGVCNALQYLELSHVDDDLQYDDVFQDDKVTIRFKEVIFKTREGTFKQEWVNMNPVSQGNEIGRFEDGETFVMPEDGYLIMPNKNAVMNAEWFYWGVEEAV